MITYLEWLEQGEPADTPFSVFRRSNVLPKDNPEGAELAAVELAMIVRDAVNHLKATKGLVLADYDPLVPPTARIHFEGIPIDTTITGPTWDDSVYFLTMSAYLVKPIDNPA